MSISFLNNINQTLILDWDTSDRWDIRFDGGYRTGGYKCLPPFDSWIPAESVENSYYTTQDMSFSAGSISDLSIPYIKSNGELNISLVDSNFIIRDYLTEWFDICYPNNATACIEDSGVLRLLTIADLGVNRQIVKQTSYIVRLNNSMSISRGSDDDLMKYNIKLKIHGINSIR